MRRKLITAIPPEEIFKVRDTSKANVSIEIRESKTYFGMPRWEVVIDGEDEEVEKFMDSLMRARAGA